MKREVSEWGGIYRVNPRTPATSSVQVVPATARKPLVEVSTTNFDPRSPDKKPPGWADIKLRKVYLKEWQDRRDGLDEDVIMQRRYQRELEVRP